MASNLRNAEMKERLFAKRLFIFRILSPHD